MDLPLLQIAAGVPILAASAFLQGAVGFAFGLFAVPALMLLGLSLPQAIALSAAGSFAQSAWASFQLRQHIEWRDATPSMAVRIAFTLVGVGLLWRGLAPHPELAKQLLGLVLLGFVVALWLFKVPPRERLHPGWAAVAMPASGLLSGLFGMGGPPLVLWAMAHRWPHARTRAFLLVNFTATSPFQMLAIWAMFRGAVTWPLLLGLASGPLVIVAGHWGLRAGHRMSEAVFRLCALALLVVMALHSLAAPFWGK